MDLTKNQPPQKQIVFPIIISNKGKGWSGNDVALKIYTPREIPTWFPSTDEHGFAFESYWLGGKSETGLMSLPGGFSYGFNLALYVDAAVEIPVGRHTVLVKFYYGRGKIARTEFTALIKAKQP